MTIEIPALRIRGARYHYLERRGHEAVTEAECVVDALLTELAAEAQPTHKLTKAGLAEAIERALAVAAAGPDVCACGHPADDHVGWLGCFECGCMTRRPHATETAPEATP